MVWPCETRTSTCRSFATISSGLYRFLAIAVLLDVKDIPQVGPLQWGWINSLRPNVSGLMSNPRFELVRHDVCFSLYVEVDKIHNLACPASPIHYQFDPVACEPRKPGRIHDSSAGEDRRTGADARLRLREPSTRGTRYSLSAARLDLSKSNCTSRDKAWLRPSLRA